MDFLTLLFGTGDGNVSFAVAWFIPAAIAAANLVGNLWSNASQNKANAKATAETNALNYKMFTEQQWYNERMWNMNNEYNSPSAWYDRMRDAGLNPSYFSMDGGSTQPQSATPPTAVAPQYDMSGYRNAFSDAAQTAMDLYLAKETKEEQLKGIRYDNISREYNGYGSIYDSELRHLNLRDEYLKRGYDEERGTSTYAQEEKYKKDVVQVHNEEMQQRKDIAKKTRLELSILQEGADSLKQMPAKELERLEKTLKGLDLDNDKKQWDKELRDKGLDPSLNWIQQLFYMAMHDKSSYRSCIQSLFEALKDAGSYLNPFSTK